MIFINYQHFKVITLQTLLHFNGIAVTTTAKINIFNLIQIIDEWHELKIVQVIWKKVWNFWIQSTNIFSEEAWDFFSLPVFSHTIMHHNLLFSQYLCTWGTTVVFLCVWYIVDSEAPEVLFLSMEISQSCDT